MTAISVYVKENKEGIAFTAAGALIGATASSSAWGLLGRFIAGVTIPSANSLTTKICSAVAFTGMQLVAESLLSSQNDPYFWLSKTISVALVSVSINYFTSISMDKHRYKSMDALLLLTIGTLLFSFSSLKDGATALGIITEVTACIGWSFLISQSVSPSSSSRPPIQTGKELAELLAFFTFLTTISISSNYFSDYHYHLFPIASIALCNSTEFGIRTSSKIFIATLAITTLATSYFHHSYNPLLQMGLLTTVFAVVNWRDFDRSKAEEKMLKYVRDRFRSFNAAIVKRIPKFSNRYKDIAEKLAAEIVALKNEKGDETTKLKARIADLLSETSSLKYKIGQLEPANAEIQRLNSDLRRAVLALEEQIETVQKRAQMRTLANEACTLLDNDIIFRQLQCALTQDPPICPVAVPNEHTFYEEAPLRHWLSSHATSPMTREPLAVEGLVKLRKLRALFLSRLEFYKKLIRENQETVHDQQALEEALEEMRRLCPKLLELFSELLPEQEDVAPVAEPHRSKLTDALDLTGPSLKKVPGKLLPLRTSVE